MDKPAADSLIDQRAKIHLVIPKARVLGSTNRKIKRRLDGSGDSAEKRVKTT